MAKVLAFINKGDLKNGKIHLTEAVIDSSTMDIVGLGEMDLMKKTLDLKLYVAPFKTLNVLTQWTPIVKNILRGKLVSVPIRVKGSFANPEITESPP